MSNIHNLLVVLILMFTASSVHGFDEIKINLAQSDIDQRVEYKSTLLKLIMEATEDEFGEYKMYSLENAVTRNRALVMMQSGEFLNVYIAPADQHWESETIPVRVPIRKGLLNYRILLTTDEYKERLSYVSSKQELMNFRLGLRDQWTTTKVMRLLGFSSTGGVDYDALFNMLIANRFDYIPRGINEIFDEYNVRKPSMPNLAIEPEIALYLPMPVYFYVSKQFPNLASRIEKGFEIIIENGSFNDLFMQHFSDDIQQANLSSRRIINLGNPTLSPYTPFSESKYWFYPIDLVEQD